MDDHIIQQKQSGWLIIRVVTDHYKLIVSTECKFLVFIDIGFAFNIVTQKMIKTKWENSSPLNSQTSVYPASTCKTALYIWKYF
jgi:hypothetical protein